MSRAHQIPTDAIDFWSEVSEDDTEDDDKGEAARAAPFLENGAPILASNGRMCGDTGNLAVLLG